MSLSEQDREILLQEIQQIQQTLEATGRNFAGDEDRCSSDDGEDEDESGDGEGLYYPANLKQEDYCDDSTKDGESPVQTPSVYSGCTYSNSAFQRGFAAISDDGSPLPDAETSFGFSDNIDQPYSNMVTTPTGASSDRLTVVTEIPKSSISAKLKQRIKQESEFGNKPAFKSKVGDNKKVPSNDSLESSSVKSHSLPTKQMEKINMANLYVERLFGGFRNKKAKSYLNAVGDKYGGKELKSSANLSSLENLLQVNRRYKELLSDELKKVELAIARNRRAQDEVATSMKEKEVKIATFASLSKACIGRFGNPYFKDNEGVGPPDNQDTVDRKRNWRVNPFLRGSKFWKNTETAALEEGVYHNNLEKRLEPWMKKLRQFDKEYKEKQKKGEKLDKGPRHQISKEIARIKELPRSEILIDPSQIDFFKISKNFLPTRDEFECRVQWCNVAHPSINQTKFSKDEDGQLIKLAKNYGNYGWENIAKELGTNRTPIQCLQRFQRTLNRDMIKTVWEEEDDDKLKGAVRLHGYNWVNVASVLGDRTGDQCMHRWLKTLDPRIKRGKWSEEEDKCLLAAVEKYGSSNWKEVRKLVSGRTDAQCRERYVSTLDPSKDWGAFNEEEDKKILELVKKHGLGKWAAIAKEFPTRRDNQIWRRYTQLEADNYHRYRRGVIWKRRSVLNYFFHRRSEKRDYSLEELDVTYSPSLNHMESRKLERMREELVKCGYTEEEITKKLARMHYEGLFSRSIYKPRQRPNSQGRSKRVSSGPKKSACKLASPELVTEIRDVLASVKDPSAELPPPPVEPLKRKTKMEREINIDGMHVILRPVVKKKGRKERWLESAVNGDVFRRKCYEVLSKFKMKTVWYDEAKNTLDNYYNLVQVPGNSFFHKQILNIYTEVSEKLQDMYKIYKEIEEMLLSSDEVPIVRLKNVIKTEAQVKREAGRGRGRPRGSRAGTVSKRKLSTFKKMVLSASREVHAPLQGVSLVDTTRVKKEIVDEVPDPCPPVAMVTTIDHSEQTNVTDTFLDTGYHRNDSNSVLANPEAVSLTEVSQNEASGYLSPNYRGSSTRMFTDQTCSTQLPSVDTPLKHELNVETGSIRSTSLQPGDEACGFDPNHSYIESSIHHKDDMEKIGECSSSSNLNQSFTTETISKDSPPENVKLTAHDNTRLANEPINGTRQSLTQETPRQGPPQNPGQLFLSDQLKTFTLLLQALHVDTTGVMDALARNSSSNTPTNSRTLSTTPFPACFPLSPNSASLLGFRKLLLHRRILGDIVRRDKMASEKLGIPVSRDLSYQNTKSYDALRKRFRSLFTWPAFLATFTPKYIDESNKSKNIPQVINVMKNDAKSTSRNVNIPTGNTTASTTTPSTPSSTVSGPSSKVTENNVEEDSEQTEVSCTKTLKTDKKQSFIDDYIQKRKRQTENKMKKQVVNDTSRKETEGPSVVISPCKKPRKELNDENNRPREDTVACSDDDDVQIKKYVSKRKSQNSDCNEKPAKKPKRRKRKDDRQSNSQAGIFIPPAVSVKVEDEIEQNLNVEIVENNES